MERTRACPLCQGQDGRLLRSVPRDAGEPGTWTLVECSACRMVYLKEFVDYETQARCFDWCETFRAESSRRDRRTPLARRASRGVRGVLKFLLGRRVPRIIRLALRHKRHGRWCDLGCGEGTLLGWVPDSFSLLGIEISAAQVEIARRRVPRAEFQVAPVTEARIAAASLDVVMMHSYLEHEREPLSALRVAWEALRPGGVVVLKTPNYGCWNRHLRRWNWCGFRFPDHCNYFTRRSLAEMVEKAGFDRLRGSVLDWMPTSDNMYLAARRPAA